MTIGFIGAGKVGTTLAKYFKVNSSELRAYDSSFKVNGFYSLREGSKAYEAAQFTDTKCYLDLDEFLSECDVIFLTVPDGAIHDVAKDISKSPSFKDKILIHTSGALSSLVFSGISEGYSIHPMCAVASATESYKEFNRVFFSIEGTGDKLEYFKGVFNALGNYVKIISPESKSKYHLAAAMASNLVVGLYSIANEELKACGFNDEEAQLALANLFLGNAIKITEVGPIEALTGPIERNDIGTVTKHLEAIEVKHRRAYIELSKQVCEVAKQKHQERDYSELEKLFDIWEERL